MRLSTANKRRKRKPHAKEYYKKLAEFYSYCDLATRLFGEPTSVIRDGRTITYEWNSKLPPLFDMTEFTDGKYIPPVVEGSFTVEGELTPFGSALLRDVFGDGEKVSDADTLCDAVEQWLEANEQGE